MKRKYADSCSVISLIPFRLTAYDGLQSDTSIKTENGRLFAGSTMPPPGHLKRPRTGVHVAPQHNKRRKQTDDAFQYPATSMLPTTDGVLPDEGQQQPDPSNTQDHNATMLASQMGSDTHDFTQNPFSPSYTLSPWPSNLSIHQILDTSNTLNGNTPGDTTMYAPLHNMATHGTMDQRTPGGLSATGSTHTDGDKDPFLSLLEQLAENEQSQAGGPSDLDFFLNGHG